MQRAAENLGYLVKDLEYRIKTSLDAIEEFKRKLDNDADEAFSWGGNYMMYAASLKVSRRALEFIDKMQGDGTDAETILRKLQSGIAEEVIRAARWPERSTSPISNVQAQERGMAYAELAVKINDALKDK